MLGPMTATTRSTKANAAAVLVVSCFLIQGGFNMFKLNRMHSYTGIRTSRNARTGPSSSSGTTDVRYSKPSIFSADLIDGNEWFNFPSYDEGTLEYEKWRQQELHPSQGLQRVYYINLLKNKKRQTLMEAWLGNQSDSEPPVPYARVNATIGISDDPNACVEHKQDMARCRGISGLAMTEVDIMKNHNTSGLTMVLEDDFSIRKERQPLQQLVRTTIDLVPADWDIIRWDCWGEIPSSFDYVVRNSSHKVFRTRHERECRPKQNSNNQPCWFCGGTHAMLWRHSSLMKLSQVWSARPFDAVDCLLTETTLDIESYCVNIGIGAILEIEGEESDIPKSAL